MKNEDGKNKGLSTEDLKGEKNKDALRSDNASAKAHKDGFVNVTMKKTVKGSLDGVTNQDFEEGEQYSIPRSLYNDFLSLQAVDAGLDNEERKENAHLQKADKAVKDAPHNK